MFTGREYSNMFGFYEYRARAYHAGLGRFMSEDPKLFDAGDYNLFRTYREV
jgi:RHS repeat-associated protein